MPVKAKQPSARKRGYTHQWEKARLSHLRREPICRMCRQMGRTTPATVVDHITPHGGDHSLFWDRNNWQSLCQPCHNGPKASMEATGAARGCDANGIPLDTGHHWRGGVRSVTSGWIPAGLKPSKVPLTIVCGPPASGKTTYATEHAEPDDLIIDLDAIRSELSGAPMYAAGRKWLRPALDERDRQLRQLGADPECDRAFFIVGAPVASDRRVWRETLKPEHVVVLETPTAVCMERIKADRRRTHLADIHAKVVQQWWRQYEADPADTVVRP